MAEAQTPVPSCQLWCQEMVAWQMGGDKQLEGNYNIYSMNGNENLFLFKVTVCWHQYNAIKLNPALVSDLIWGSGACTVHTEMSLGFNILFAWGNLHAQGLESCQLHSSFFLIIPSILGS